MPQQFLSDLRKQYGWGGGDVRNEHQRSADQRNANTGNPRMSYNYSYDQNMGGQDPSLGRYRPPMMDTNGGWQDNGGYAYNLPTNAGPFGGSFGSGYGPPIPQFMNYGQQFAPQANGLYYTQQQGGPQMAQIGGAKPQGPETMQPPQMDQAPQYGGRQLPPMAMPSRNVVPDQKMASPDQQRAVADIMNRMRMRAGNAQGGSYPGGAGLPTLPIMQRGVDDRYRRMF